MSRSIFEGGWSVLYKIIHLMACYIMIPIYMVVAIFDAIFHPFKELIAYGVCNFFTGFKTAARVEINGSSSVLI
jgi:hypothetical protein